MYAENTPPPQKKKTKKKTKTKQKNNPHKRLQHLLNLHVPDEMQFVNKAVQVGISSCIQRVP